MTKNARKRESARGVAGLTQLDDEDDDDVDN